MQKESSVKKIDADNAEGLLLQAVLVFQHSDVDDDLAVFVPRVGLKFHPHPAMALVGAMIVARRHRVGESEESGAVAARRAQALQIQGVS